MADIGLALLEAAVKRLYKVYKDHKDAKRELQEVGNFLLDLRANSPILNAKSDRLEHVKNTLRGKLESSRKQVENLSCTKSGFIHSDETLRKIQRVRQKVKDAMEEANTQMQVGMCEHQDAIEGKLNEILMRIPRKPAKEHHRNAVVPAKHPTPAKLNVQHPKPHPSKLGAQGIAITSPRSKSSPGRPILPSKAPPSSKAPSPMPRAASANTPRRDEKVELFVPMDSDKQARDVEEKLKALVPGVKDVFHDQTSKKVIVVPLKGVTLDTKQLLQHAHLENKYVAPTLWSKRPR